MGKDVFSVQGESVSQAPEFVPNEADAASFHKMVADADTTSPAPHAANRSRHLSSEQSAKNAQKAVSEYLNAKDALPPDLTTSSADTVEQYDAAKHVELLKRGAEQAANKNLQVQKTAYNSAHTKDPSSKATEELRQKVADAESLVRQVEGTSLGLAEIARNKLHKAYQEYKDAEYLWDPYTAHPTITKDEVDRSREKLIEAANKNASSWAAAGTSAVMDPDASSDEVELCKKGLDDAVADQDTVSKLTEPQ